MSLTRQRSHRRVRAGAALLGLALLAPLVTVGTASGAGTVLLTGTVRDGSGHGWPLLATVGLADPAAGTTHTDPVTGAFELRVPADSTQTVHVQADLPGYLPADQQLTIGDGDTAADLQLAVDAGRCTAPGYRYRSDGLLEGFDGSGTPAGWTTVDNIGTGQGWRFDDPGKRGNHTGSSGGFAILDSDFYGWERQDAELISPVIDLTGVTDPSVGLDYDFTMYDYNEPSGIGDVDLSIDGGTSWTNVWKVDLLDAGPKSAVAPIPAAANQSQVRVRLHYTETQITAGLWWAVDNLYVGNRSCDPVSGGLVVGQITDANTGDPVNGATVTVAGTTATSAPTPDDPELGDGFYSVFAPATGGQTVAAAKRQYVSVRQQTNVRSNWTTEVDLGLQSGRLTVQDSAVESTQVLGVSASRPVRISNTGTAPMTVTVAERPGDFTSLAATGEPAVTAATTAAAKRAAATATGAIEPPAKRTKGEFLPYKDSGDGTAGATAPTKAAVTAAAKAAAAAADAGGAGWIGRPDYPIATGDNAAAALNGKVYSFGGAGDFGTTIANSYVMDTATGAWKRIPDMPVARQAGIAAAIDGKVYVTGGWSDSLTTEMATSLDIYDPGSNSWSAGPSIPTATAAAASAVLDGSLYVIGGCRLTYDCGDTGVFRYDVAAKKWTRLADYPTETSWMACGAIEAKIYCAGGVGDDPKSNGTGTIPSKAVYMYDPAADTWTPRAAMPTTNWAMASTVSNGKLLISGGVINSFVTNEGIAYDPLTDSWSKLPNATNQFFRGGSACGFVKIAGGQSWASYSSFVEQLPGNTDCGSDRDSSWLSEATTTVKLEPGAATTISLTFDGGSVDQPGDYTAAALLRTDTPYAATTVPVTMHLTAPKKWGKVVGTVSGQGCSGAPAPSAGADVTLSSWNSSVHLTTGADGRYERWLDVRNNPVTVIAGRDDWLPDSGTARLKANRVTVVDLTLERLDCG